MPIFRLGIQPLGPIPLCMCLLEFQIYENVQSDHSIDDALLAGRTTQYFVL